MTFRSSTIRLYADKIASLTEDQVKFVDEVYAICERNYSAGGDRVVECFEPADVLADFKSLDDVKEYAGAKVEQALNCREGNDDDSELMTYDRFINANWEAG